MEWIRIKDELPTLSNGQEWTFTSFLNGRQVFGKRYDLQKIHKELDKPVIKTKLGYGNKKACYDISDEELKSILTYWMPLPEPPKDQNESTI